MGYVLDITTGFIQLLNFSMLNLVKGPAFVRTKLKNVETGKVIDNTFTAGHKIDVVRVERRKEVPISVQ